MSTTPRKNPTNPMGELKARTADHSPVPGHVMLGVLVKHHARTRNFVDTWFEKNAGKSG